jgi:hypothetical protein
MDHAANWTLRGWTFFYERQGSSRSIRVPDCGGMADMVPKDAEQLAWAEGAFGALPGLQRVWATTWSIEDDDADAALRAFWQEQGGNFEAENWKESWWLGADEAWLRRSRAGTLFYFLKEASSDEGAAARGLLEDRLSTISGVRRTGGWWEVRSGEGLDALRAAWVAAGGRFADAPHPWSEVG